MCLLIKIAQMIHITIVFVFLLKIEGGNATYGQPRVSVHYDKHYEGANDKDWAD